MLKKLNRITRDKDFKKIFKRSKKIDTKNLVIRIAKRNIEHNRHQSSSQISTNPKKLPADSYQLPRGSRFGFVVSNKINKRATRRNALKRRLRAAVREILPNIDPNIDVIVLVKKDFEYPYKYQAIKEQIQEGLQETLSAKS